MSARMAASVWGEMAAFRPHQRPGLLWHAALSRGGATVCLSPSICLCVEWRRVAACRGPAEACGGLRQALHDEGRKKKGWGRGGNIRHLEITVVGWCVIQFTDDIKW